MVYIVFCDNGEDAYAFDSLDAAERYWKSSGGTLYRRESLEDALNEPKFDGIKRIIETERVTTALETN